MSKAESNVDRIYARLRQMAVDFEFKPDARINESQLASALGASRTPLREALNRLAAEGFLVLHGGRGFFCRPLDPDSVMDLYEARVAIEAEIVRRACDRASDQDLESVAAYLDATEPEYDTSLDVARLLAIDEGYHLKIAEIAKNRELTRILDMLNGRIRYVRLIGLKLLVEEPSLALEEASKLSAHRIILEALLRRDSAAAEAMMRRHIERRRAEATNAVKLAYAQLYVPEP